MYLPQHFEEHDTELLHSVIRAHGFGTLVVAGPEGIEANHVPFYLDTSAPGSRGVLECHVARSNKVWQQIDAGASVLAMFLGPDAYVSPSWYPTKAETGRVVPTWNYVAVHARGRARTVQDPNWLLSHLNKLTDQHEAGRASPWSVGDAPEDYIHKLTGAVVGIELTIDELIGKRKASQNQPERNRRGVVEGMRREGSEASMAIVRHIPE